MILPETQNPSKTDKGFLYKFTPAIFKRFNAR